MDLLDTNNIVVVADQHIGCGSGLMHPVGGHIDTGQIVKPSTLQRKLWRVWEYFWNDWVPRATRGEPYIVVNCGDALEGVHHQAISQWSQNDTVDHISHAERILRPVVERAEAYYHLRGTEAHGGASGKLEEALAKNLGAVPDEFGHHARWELYKRIGSVKGKDGATVHFSHHIGVSGSQQYESSAPMRELTEVFVEAGRWAERGIAAVVRGHRHRALQLRIPARIKGMPNSMESLAVIVPGWQLKTPLTHRVAGARTAQPQFGGAIISCHQGVLYATGYTQRMPRPKEA